MKICKQCNHKITDKQPWEFLYLIPADTEDGTVGVYVHRKKCLDRYNEGEDLVDRTAGGVDKGVYVGGPHRWYWIDTGTASGAVVLHKVSGKIIDCAPIWRRWFIGLRLTDVVRLNPEVRIVRLGDGRGGEKEAVRKGRGEK